MDAAQARRIAAAHRQYSAQHYQAILQTIKESALAGEISVLNPHSAIDPQPELKQLEAIWAQLRENGYVVECIYELFTGPKPTPRVIVRW